MKTLTSHLCGVFQCSFEELPEAIRQNRTRVIDLLQKLPLLTGHSGVHLPIKCDSVTRRGPRDLFARGGQLGVTVEQLFFTLHEKEVKSAHLPCISVYYADIEAEGYYPIELTFVDL